MAKEEINKKDNTKTNRNKYIKLYIIPITTLVTFLTIIIFLIIPKVSEILSQLDLISTNDNLIANKNTEINNLQTLTTNINSINENLNTINQLAPTGVSEVVKFRDEITLIIKQNNLTINSQQLNESSVDTKNTNDPAIAGSIFLQEVPFIFELNGNYNDIINFITALNNVPDFIIIKEMELNAQQGTSNSSQSQQNTKWTFKMNIVKYQFKNIKDDVLNKVYLAVSSTIKIDKTISDYLILKKNDLSGNSQLIQGNAPQQVPQSDITQTPSTQTSQGGLPITPVNRLQIGK